MTEPRPTTTTKNPPTTQRYDNQSHNGNVDGGASTGHNFSPSATTSRKRARHLGNNTNTTTSSTAFVSSMTFASLQRHNVAGCDCDECGLPFSSRPPDPVVPDLVLRAIQQHKRQRPTVRTQDRTLQARNPTTGVSVWQWTMPPHAKPLLEYGSTCHRLVWVQRLPPGRQVQSIGRGIVGSRAEEQSRPYMDWTQGGVYFVPCRPGTAVGWINAASMENTKKREVAEGQQDNVDESPVVLIIAKVPVEKKPLQTLPNPSPSTVENKTKEPNATKPESVTTDVEHPREKEPQPLPWATVIHNACFQQESQLSQSADTDSSSDSPPLSFLIAEEDAIPLKQAITTTTT